MKTCNKCNEPKPTDEFYKHPQTKDGRLGHCKACHRSAVSANRRANIAHYAKYERARLDDPKRVKARRDYFLANKDQPEWKAKRAASRKRWVEENQDKVAAHTLLNNSLKNGRIVKKPCEKCGEEKVEAHHDDYTRPLDVRWLCHKHHSEEHRGDT